MLFRPTIWIQGGNLLRPGRRDHYHRPRRPRPPAALTRILDRKRATLGRECAAAILAVSGGTPEHFTNHAYDASGRIRPKDRRNPPTAGHVRKMARATAHPLKWAGTAVAKVFSFQCPFGQFSAATAILARSVQSTTPHNPINQPTGRDRCP